jgi:hypothetical protein
MCYDSRRFFLPWFAYGFSQRCCFAPDILSSQKGRRLKKMRLNKIFRRTGRPIMALSTLSESLIKYFQEKEITPRKKI